MNREYYQLFTTENFLEDNFFRKWILQPDTETEGFWQSYLQDNPQKRTAILEARELLESVHTHFDAEIKNITSSKAKASFNQIATKLAKPKNRSNSINRWKVWGLAAAAIGLLIISLGSFLFFFQENHDSSFATGNGQRLTVELPDGSSVQLNANSILTFNSKDWAGNNRRQVWLEGEAYFKVEKKTKGTKFIVHAGAMKVAVLGTQFNVRSRSERAEVVLAEGKIELDVANQHFTMKPGDLVSFSKNQSKLEAKRVKAADYASWKDGITIFNDVLSEVVKELEILYGVSFQIKNEQLKNRKIQLSAPTDSLEQVLETLALLYPDEISIEKGEDKVIIF